ncbi:DUF6588 family protein [Polaribacter sp. Asnod1-A03]|uniref:DUF6588 family protein n=1 Tax=Polaribacter sp. Asnod1-A03 TaxID=3160581 RepID=UPI00386AB5A7
MRTIIVFAFIFCCKMSFGQIDLEYLLEGGTSDASTFLKGYTEPAPIGFGNGINGGWYTTAKAHKVLGFDIAVIASASFVPTKSETFTFNNADYTNIKLYNSNSTSAELPTLFGSQKLEDRPLLEFSNSDGNTISASTLPGVGIKESIDYNVVPSAMIQAGVGLFKNTDLKIRFIPKQTDDEYEFSTFGIGIMHDIKQWIPFVKRLPFDLSALVAWNDVKTKFYLDEIDEPTQALEFNTKTFMFQLLASKKLSIFTLYGGVGTSSYETDVNVLGRYVTTEDDVYIDPIQLEYNGNSMKANLGLSVQLLFINIAAEYALQEYDVFSVRVGFSVR